MSMPKNFKRIISSVGVNKKSFGQYLPVVEIDSKVRITIQIDKNNQICEIVPRTFGSKNLFDKYKGRTASWVTELIAEAEALEPKVDVIKFK
jgi:hypothetical protein